MNMLTLTNTHTHTQHYTVAVLLSNEQIEQK